MQWVCKLALFLVLSSILLEMIADTKYYKFARWVAGVILLLQFISPLTEGEKVWSRFTTSLLSFDYALGADKVVEELYQVDEATEGSVLENFKSTVAQQLERILERNGLRLMELELQVAETGEILDMQVEAQYLDGGEPIGLLIPTVAPVRIGERKKTGIETVSPMELYIREVLAEFYQLDENKIEVVIQEAE